jgi:anti-sigma B factor antagonist
MDYLEANVVRDGSECATVIVVGEVDLCSVSVLRAAIDDAWSARPKTLRIDLSSVTYFDSTGLREVTRIFDDCSRHGVRLSLAGASRNVRRVFVLTGLSHVLGDTSTDPGDADARHQSA